MTIKNYVDVDISMEAARMARLGFNKPLFLFAHETLDRAKEISTSDYEDADLGGTESDLYEAFQSYLSQPVVAPTVIIGCKRVADASWAAAISAVRAEKDTWYGVVSVTKAKADIVAIAAVVETLDPGRLHFAVTPDADVLNKVENNTAETLATIGYYRTAICYGTDTDKWANAAQAAYLGYDPGSITFNYKELRGVKPEVITAAQRQNLIDQKCQVQRTVAGLKRLVDSGMVCSGEWIDIMHGIDWLTARISENVFAIIATVPKLPYTDNGGAVLGTEVKRNLAIAATDPYNFINEDFVVNVPAVAAQDPADRANRKFPGITFSATPQGAIHDVVIRGKLVI